MFLFLHITSVKPTINYTTKSENRKQVTLVTLNFCLYHSMSDLKKTKKPHTHKKTNRTKKTKPKHKNQDKDEIICKVPVLGAKLGLKSNSFSALIQLRECLKSTIFNRHVVKLGVEYIYLNVQSTASLFPYSCRSTSSVLAESGNMINMITVSYDPFLSHRFLTFSYESFTVWNFCSPQFPYSSFNIKYYSFCII